MQRLEKKIDKFKDWFRYGDIKISRDLAEKIIQGELKPLDNDEIATSVYEFIVNIIGDDPSRCEFFDGYFFMVADCEGENYDALLVVNKYTGEVIKAWWK